MHRLNLDLEVLDVALALRMKDLKMLAESIGLLSFLYIILMLFCLIKISRSTRDYLLSVHGEQDTLL